MIWHLCMIILRCWSAHNSLAQCSTGIVGLPHNLGARPRTEYHEKKGPSENAYCGVDTSFRRGDSAAAFQPAL